MVRAKTEPHCAICGRDDHFTRYCPGDDFGGGPGAFAYPEEVTKPETPEAILKALVSAETEPGPGPEF